MAQADQSVQNATFPAVRADINDNLAALFSQSSGPSAPAVTVAYQPWIDTSASPAVWKVRNATNTDWITVGTLDPTAGFASGGITPIASGGTGQTTATAALTALLPSQAGNAGKSLTTNGTVASWGTIAAGVSIQSFTSSTTYTPTSGKTTFLVFATGGGGGSGSSDSGLPSGGGGGGGTAIRVYTAAEMGANATVSIGAGGTAGSVSGSNGGAGGSTVFTPAGTGAAITGAGGSGSGLNGWAGAVGGGSTNSTFSINGQKGGSGVNQASAGGNGGASFWAGGRGAGGNGVYSGTAAVVSGNAGTGGVIMVLEW